MQLGIFLIGDKQLGFNAPMGIRADNLVVESGGTRIRYVNCPESPFSGTNDQKVCESF